MSQPTFIDQYLTGVSNAWFNADTDFIGNLILPEVIVAKKTFKVPNYTKETLRIPSSSVRTGEAKSKRVNLYRSSQDVGPLQEHSLADFVTRDDYRMTDSPYNPEGDSVENMNHKLMLIDEKDIATQLSDTAIVTNNITLSGGDQFSDYSSSNPFNVIKNAAIAMRADTLKIPNTFFTSWDAWIQMVDHPDFLDRIKWSQTGVMTEADFLKLFAPYGISKIFIGKAQENTAKQGLTDSLSSIWSKHAWLAYITDRPGLKQVNGGYKFRLQNGREVTREPKNNPPGTELINRDYYDNVLLNNECFYLIKNVVA